MLGEEWLSAVARAVFQERKRVVEPGECAHDGAEISVVQHLALVRWLVKAYDGGRHEYV